MQVHDFKIQFFGNSRPGTFAESFGSRRLSFLTRTPYGVCSHAHGYGTSYDFELQRYKDFQQCSLYVLHHWQVLLILLNIHIYVEGKEEESKGKQECQKFEVDLHSCIMSNLILSCRRGRGKPKSYQKEKIRQVSRVVRRPANKFNINIIFF